MNRLLITVLALVLTNVVSGCASVNFVNSEVTDASKGDSLPKLYVGPTYARQSCRERSPIYRSLISFEQESAVVFDTSQPLFTQFAEGVAT